MTAALALIFPTADLGSLSLPPAFDDCFLLPAGAADLALPPEALALPFVLSELLTPFVEELLVFLAELLPLPERRDVFFSSSS